MTNTRNPHQRRVTQQQLTMYSYIYYIDLGCKVFYLRVIFYINFYNFALGQELQTDQQL